MAYPKSSTLPPSEFDVFLLSNVGIQPNGMPLTVLSLLARIGVDPWNEAERLSVLPNELAVSWLAKAISRCPPDSVAPSNAIVLASDLVDRLPGASDKLRFDGTIPSGLEDTPTLRLMMLFYVGTCVFLVMLLAMS
jgi:hypothetical protein